MINHFTFTSFLGFKIHTFCTILVTASAMPMALKIMQMPNAGDIGLFIGQFIYAHNIISFISILYPPKLYQIVKLIDYFLLYELFIA